MKKYKVVVSDCYKEERTILENITMEEREEFLNNYCKYTNSAHYGIQFWLRDDELEEMNIPYRAMGWKVDIYEC